MILLLICALLFLAYGILVNFYRYAWERIKEETPSSDEKLPFFSIIIPARNEEKNIGHLLQALAQLQYPREKMECIVVDDHSEDGTAAVAARFPQVKLISLREEGINSYKKKAIETGIANAKGDWILTTDADCIPGPGWLSKMAGHARLKNAVMLVAPVQIRHNGSLLPVFQSMDFMILQTITGAVVSRKWLSMCNGANLAYRREAFYTVNGFEGIDRIASGDDMLLLHKIWQQFPDGVYYVKAKEAIVETAAAPSWRAFFQQRIRWASKAVKYEDKGFLPVLLLVYFFNCCFIALLLAAAFHPYYWKWVLLYWLGKTVIELPLLISGARFFGMMSLLPWFFFLQPLHIVYTIISGLFGQMGHYEWKGRKVR